jgi:DNA-directed RNA polymerase subunit RPC12/RpoP
MTTPYQELKLTDQYGPAAFHWAWYEAAHGQLMLWERVYVCQGCGKEMTLRPPAGAAQDAPAGPCPGCGGTLLAKDR